ncbi:MAG: FCD domain-containing protein [Pseudomonadota bacterium]
MPFTPVAAANIAEAAAAQIRELIAHDVLAPGDTLPGERALAARMGISRTSLRAALQTLTAEGLLISRHGSGLRVAEDTAGGISEPLERLLASTPDAFEDYIRFRSLIEGASAAEAARHADRTARASIARAHDAMAAAVGAGALDAAAWADAEFHMAIVEAAGNVVTIQIARSLQTLMQRGIAQSHAESQDDPEAWAALVAQHTRILAALDAGEAEPARRAMQDHLTFQIALLRQTAARVRQQDLSERRLAWGAEKSAPKARDGT